MEERKSGTARVFAGLGLLTLCAQACLDLGSSNEAASSGGKGGTAGGQVGGAAGWPGSGGTGGVSASGGTGAASDGAADAIEDQSADAGQEAEAGPPCDLTKPFGARAPIAELSMPGGVGAAHLTHDELTIYYHVSSTTDAGGSADVWTATRASKTAAFGTPKVLANVNTSLYEVDPSPTADNLTLYFSSDRAGGKGGFDLWSATRSNPTAAFGNVLNVGALNTAGWDFSPYVMPDDLTLYFTSEPTPGQDDLFRATRTLTTPFSLDTSGVFDNVNTSAIEDFPVVAPNELTLYFTSNRTGGMGKGDVWKAIRGNKSQAFGSVENVSELNTSADEGANWISDDGCRIYLFAAGDIWVATKPKS